MKLRLIAALWVLVPAAASAQSMNAEQFYQRATALQHKGMLAIFSRGEVKSLTTEAQAAGKQAAENRRAALKVGQEPRFCPPAGSFNMNDKEFMAGLSALPAAERARIDMTEVMTRLFAARFPCRA
ncbi:MAG: hypothetical protein ABI853_03575 [Sphingomicrobium sp.]